jgi:hypothetical protein
MGANGTVAKHYGQGAAMEVCSAEQGHTAASKCFDDDGRLKRTGTMWTASAHIITAVIGSGVLSLAWAIAQLGWVAGPAVMLLFSLVTYYTSALLSDCYRSGDETTGKRNYTYMDAVNANLSKSSPPCERAFLPACMHNCTARTELTLFVVSSCRWRQGPDLRLPAIRQHRRRCHRIHHRRLH